MQEEKSYSPPPKEIPYTVPMDAVRELVVSRLGEIGETLKSASEKLGKNHAYLQQFIQRGIPVKLPEDVRRALAQLLDIDENQLKPDGSAIGFQEPQAPFRNAVLGGPVRLGKIPLYGQAVGGDDGQFPLNGSRITDINAPPALAEVAGAYAVMVVGSSMEPRYFAGEAVFINPRLPVRPGDFVVAQIGAEVEGDSPLAYVKRYLGRSKKAVQFEQFNPRREISFPNDRVVSIHRIVMSGEG